MYFFLKVLFNPIKTPINYFLCIITIVILIKSKKENGSFSVHSFDEHYLSIPQFTGSTGDRFQETHSITMVNHLLLILFSFRFWTGWRLWLQTYSFKRSGPKNPRLHQQSSSNQTFWLFLLLIFLSTKMFAFVTKNHRLFCCNNVIMPEVCCYRSCYRQNILHLFAVDSAGQSVPIPHFEPFSHYRCGSGSQTHLLLYVCIYLATLSNYKVSLL